jgi:hypothetical protein
MTDDLQVDPASVRKPDRLDPDIDNLALKHRRSSVHGRGISGFVSTQSLNLQCSTRERTEYYLPATQAKEKCNSLQQISHN